MAKEQKEVKKEEKKEAKKEEAPKQPDMKVLEERYKKLFNSVVEVIQKEENAVIVYQVLVDILMQLEKQIKSQMGNKENCSQSCDSCKTCEEHKK
ncbi:Uncharacterised protein [Candidatus Tiddalikarchaeum anstoanum]|nr:Uncharacterised protein [Candidatus Tiddalikarchaeum anstoanum]